MDYGDSTMSHAITIERTFVEFFHNVKAVLRTVPKITDCRQRWDDAPARDLQRHILSTQGLVDAALKDDFDTPTAISCLLELVRATNIYMELCEQTPMTPVSLILRNSAKFVTHMFKIFGLIPDSAAVDIGFPISSSESSSSSSSDEVLTPILDALMDFRTSVRDKARTKDMTGVLDQCDSFRDDVLPSLGIRLEDKIGKSVWKLADPAELKREREQKELEKARREEEKRLAAEEMAKKEAICRMSPADFMKQLTLDEDPTKLKYSVFDETGMPTHFHDGETLNKNQMKKAMKEFQSQQKKFEKYNSNT
jgi:cysteinyl-tRNA synthetase